MKGERIIGFAVIALMLVGCAKTGPQIPSQRKGSVAAPDSAQLALLSLNQHLAETADEQLRLIVQTQEEPYALYEANTWMTVIDRGDETGGSPQDNEEWTVKMRIYDLNGQLLMDSERSYRIGKKELPQGVDENIGNLYRNGKARLFVPWYAAFGVTGTNDIAPYENVMIEIELR